jgi:hypothetical protein
MQSGVFILKMNPKGRGFGSPSGHFFFFRYTPKSQYQYWNLTIFIEITSRTVEFTLSFFDSNNKKLKIPDPW